ncbi:MAG: hypothetical protein KAS77_09555, partial [Thermoplasmata archaeon]|nr:hypothetical protein [Thermoplasmata archaeon]
MTPIDITDSGSGIYNLTIVLPRYSGIPIEYWFWTNDTSGNRNMTAIYLIDIVDDDDSLFTITPLPREVTTGQILEPLVFVRDQDIGIASVVFTWWFDVVGDPEPTTLNMVPRLVDPWGNGHYTLTFQVPFDVPYSFAPPIMVTFSVTDLSGNNLTTGVIVLILRDDDPPWFLEAIVPDVPTTGDPFNLTVRVWDNIALSSVWVDYRLDKGLVGNISLLQVDETTWTESITIPTTATFISFTFIAMDTSGNGNWSERINLLVVDNDPPVIVTDNSDVEFKTSGTITFEVIALDNMVVEQVMVHYWTGMGMSWKEELVGEDLDRRKCGAYIVTLDTPDGINTSLTYVIEVRDGSGNIATQGERYIGILDDDPPSFLDDLSDEEAWRGEVFNFSAEVWDNVGVAALSCEWWFGEDGHYEGPVPLNSSLAIDIPLDPVGPLRFFFTIFDAAGNIFSTDVFQREVLNVPPTLAGLDVWSVMEEEHEELDLRQF